MRRKLCNSLINLNKSREILHVTHICRKLTGQRMHLFLSVQQFTTQFSQFVRLLFFGRTIKAARSRYERHRRAVNCEAKNVKLIYCTHITILTLQGQIGSLRSAQKIAHRSVSREKLVFFNLYLRKYYFFNFFKSTQCRSNF